MKQKYLISIYYVVLLNFVYDDGEHEAHERPRQQVLHQLGRRLLVSRLWSNRKKDGERRCREHEHYHYW